MAIDTFWGYLFKKDEEKQTLKLLRKSPFFSTLTYVEMMKVYKLLHHRRFSFGETIFRENEPGESLYFIKSGGVKIFTLTMEGKEKELAVLEAGMFFGEVSLIDESPRSASALAVENAELLVFLREDLLNLMDRDPRLASKILMQLSLLIGKRLRETNLRLQRYTKDA